MRSPPPPLVSIDASLLHETQLLRAIQALDDVSGSPRPSPADLARLWRAWAFFLELTTALETPRSRARLALVLEARVLSCVARFLATPWQQWACQQNATHHCIANAMRSIVGCFLYHLSRHASTAMLVLRSGLFAFLFDTCRSVETANNNSSSASVFVPCDARDVTIAVDALDWATRALAAALQRDGPAAAVFLVPVGPQTLAHLLRDHDLPTNEADEVQYLRPSASSPSKPRRVPSMFTFLRTLVSDNDDCSVCCPRYNAAVWSVVTRSSTSLHFAVRALVALVLHVPPTSPEGKTLRRNGIRDVLDRMVRMARADRADEQDAHVMDVIRAMGIAGLEHLRHEMPTKPPTSVSPTRAKPTTASLGERLHAITESSRLKATQQCDEERARQAALGRATHRDEIQAAYANAMATRAHLLHSLSVLSTGRVHPAAHDQTLGDWLGSFSTLEAKEQQRREREELKQRRLLEQQYEIDERRRRERDERAAMAQNDVDTIDTSAADRANAQRQAFTQLQQELQLLQAKEEAERQANANELAKREAARNEALRLQRLTDERRREATERTLMAKEDHYYAEKIVREKRAREAQAASAKRVDPIAEQQQQIARMRQRDFEAKQCEREQQEMRSEDLRSRQRRFLEAEATKKQVERERRERERMSDEERWGRQQWKRIDEALAKQQQADAKAQRAEQRRAEREWRAWQAAWVACYDAAGNRYFYNQLSGASQWEDPFAPTASAAATWPGTS